jgi:hypothetical protein
MLTKVISVFHNTHHKPSAICIILFINMCSTYLLCTAQFYSNTAEFPFISAVRAALLLHVYLCEIIGECVNWLRVNQSKYLTCLWEIVCGNDVIAEDLISYLCISIIKVSKGKGQHITGQQGPRVSGGMALIILNLGVRRSGLSAQRPGRFKPWKDQVSIVQKAEWAKVSVWTCGKNFAPTGIRSPGRPARSQSLYRLNFPAHTYLVLT